MMICNYSVVVKQHAISRASFCFRCVLYVDSERLELLIHLLHSLFALVVRKKHIWSVVWCDGEIHMSLSWNVDPWLYASFDIPTS